MSKKITAILSAAIVALSALLVVGFYFPDSSRMINGVSYDWDLAMSRGEVPGHSTNRKFGKNSALDTTYEAITDISEPYEFPTSAQILDIVSADANDSGVVGNDTGAFTITVIGLDSDWNEQTETVTLTGQTVAKTTNAFTRVNRAFIASAGTYGGTNEGDITISTTTDSDTVAQISAGEGQTRQAVYTVPAGKTAYIRRVTVAAASNKSVEFRGRIRLNADDTSAPVAPIRTVFEQVGISAPFTFKGDEFNAFPEKTDIWIEAKGASTPSGSAAFGIELVDN